MKDIQKLINNDKYQVFLMSCRANMPAFFASHNWFVVNDQGNIERWEAGYMKCIGEKNYGHLRKNLLKAAPFQGISIVPGINKNFRWKSQMLGYIEGKEHSLAKKMAEFIQKSPSNYPYVDHYSLLGPNSNTYPQWVINHFPDSGLFLPQNAIGKNFRS